LKQELGLADSSSAMVIEKTPPPVPAVPAVPRAEAAKPKEDVREMTAEEKRLLSENINNLPPNNLGELVQIIHQRMPQLTAGSAHPDEIEIDLESLDAGTLRFLEKYVKQVQSKKKKKGEP